MKTVSPEPADPRRAYHHGDLRRELLRVAREEIARVGPAGITLSSLARLAQVSQGAPYRHFANMNSLLEALAVQGFEESSAAVDLAAASCGAQGELQAITLAYVAYAERNIELYRLMFASRLVPQAAPKSPLADAADRAFEQLRRVVAKTSPARSVRDDTILIWAQLHGLVMLKADGLIESALGRFVKMSPLLAPKAGGVAPARKA